MGPPIILSYTFIFCEVLDLFLFFWTDQVYSNDVLYQVRLDTYPLEINKKEILLLDDNFKPIPKLYLSSKYPQLKTPINFVLELKFRFRKSPRESNRTNNQWLDVGDPTSSIVPPREVFDKLTAFFKAKEKNTQREGERLIQPLQTLWLRKWKDKIRKKPTRSNGHCFCRRGKMPLKVDISGSWAFSLNYKSQKLLGLSWISRKGWKKRRWSLCVIDEMRKLKIAETNIEGVVFWSETLQRVVSHKGGISFH